MSANDPQPPDEAVPTPGSKQATEYDAERSQIGADLAEEGVEQAAQDETQAAEPGAVSLPPEASPAESDEEAEGAPRAAR